MHSVNITKRDARVVDQSRFTWYTVPKCNHCAMIFAPHITVKLHSIFYFFLVTCHLISFLANKSHHVVPGLVGTFPRNRKFPRPTRLDGLYHCMSANSESKNYRQQDYYLKIDDILTKIMHFLQEINENIIKVSFFSSSSGVKDLSYNIVAPPLVSQFNVVLNL